MNFTINIKVTKRGNTTRIPESSDIGTEILTGLHITTEEVAKLQSWVDTHYPEIALNIPYPIATKWACFRHTNVAYIEVSYDLLQHCWGLVLEGNKIETVINEEGLLNLLDNFVATTPGWEFPKRILSPGDFDLTDDVRGTYKMEVPK